jgi:hypothetical protein
MKIKRLLAAASLAGVFGATLFASSSVAGPLLLGPVRAPISTPKVFVRPLNTVPIQKTLLTTYRQVRAFWLSRAIVR